MFDIGGGELLLILVAVVVLFGPKKLPEVAQMIGKGMQQVRKAQAQFTSQINDIQNEVKSTIEEEPVKEPKKAPVREIENKTE
jgi:TatA/E family protein of Tat protein translocase